MDSKTRKERRRRKEIIVWIMTIEEVIDRAVQFKQSIEIEYCSRNGKIFSCEISKITYSRFYGGAYIHAYCTGWGVNRTFKVSRILKVNGHSFSRIYWDQIGDVFKKIY